MLYAVSSSRIAVNAGTSSGAVARIAFALSSPVAFRISESFVLCAGVRFLIIVSIALFLVVFAFIALISFLGGLYFQGLSAMMKNSR